MSVGAHMFSRIHDNVTTGLIKQFPQYIRKSWMPVVRRSTAAVSCHISVTRSCFTTIFMLTRGIHSCLVSSPCEGPNVYITRIPVSSRRARHHHRSRLSCAISMCRPSCLAVNERWFNGNVALALPSQPRARASHALLALWNARI